MTVKANTPTLYAQLKKLPWKNVPGFSHVAKDHGRRTRRTVKAALAPWIQEHWHIENKLRQASKTLRRFTTLQLRCGSGPGACSTWRQRLSC